VCLCVLLWVCLGEREEGIAASVARVSEPERVPVTCCALVGSAGRRFWQQRVACRGALAHVTTVCGPLQQCPSKLVRDKLSAALQSVTMAT
jgi:hypothetical protein